MVENDPKTEIENTATHVVVFELVKAGAYSRRAREVNP
jgi:hypothetical protein